MLLSVMRKSHVSTICCHVSEGKRMCHSDDSLWENQDAMLNIFWAAKVILILRFYKSLCIHTSQNISLKRQDINRHLKYISDSKAPDLSKRKTKTGIQGYHFLFTILLTGNHTIMMLALTAHFLNFFCLILRIWGIKISKNQSNAR